MISKWTLGNFKSVREETELDFAPLTIFAGANSSGKSTLLQSVLLIAQTLAHKVSSRSVVLNGAFVRLGQFDDIMSFDSDNDAITIGWTCRVDEDGESAPILRMARGMIYSPDDAPKLVEVDCRLRFDANDAQELAEIAKVQPLLASVVLTGTTRYPDGSTGQHRNWVQRRTPKEQKDVDLDHIEGLVTDDKRLLRALRYRPELDEDSLMESRKQHASGEPVGCEFMHFLPVILAMKVDRVAEDTHEIVDLLTKARDSRRLSRRRAGRRVRVPDPVVGYVLSSLQGGSVEDERTRQSLQTALTARTEESGAQTVTLGDVAKALEAVEPTARKDLAKRLADDSSFEELVRNAVSDDRADGEDALDILTTVAPGPVSELVWYIDSYFSTSVRYLGPLRDEPRSLYPLSPTTDPSDVGVRGEHTAAVLDLHKDLDVTYIPASGFDGPEGQRSPVTKPLQEAVTDWLRYLDVAEHVESCDRGKLGHELTVTVASASRAHDLTHVGVGVSQVLPILVASLLAEPDTTLIFEQPELHLHPKVQTRLADFFLSMTLLGKQCLVETHSEYLINRVRLRMAAAEGPEQWMDKVLVYFVEKHGQSSQFRKVDINEYGAIVDWPQGFFDQSQDEAEAILRAAMLKRKARRDQTP